MATRQAMGIAPAWAFRVPRRVRGARATARGCWMNHLYYGDNLAVLRASIGDETVDRIYLDPPFRAHRPRH